MCGGMGIEAPKCLWISYRVERNDPESQFLYNDKGTQAFLLANFSLLHTDNYQRFQAKTWAAVIYYYFRKGWPDSRIESELELEKGEVGSIVQQIRRKIKGLRRNGKPYSTRKRGRPRKVVVLLVETPAIETPAKQAA
jgi:hypothetical protein